MNEIVDNIATSLVKKIESCLEPAFELPGIGQQGEKHFLRGNPSPTVDRKQFLQIGKKFTKPS